MLPSQVLHCEINGKAIQIVVSIFASFRYDCIFLSYYEYKLDVAGEDVLLEFSTETFQGFKWSFSLLLLSLSLSFSFWHLFISSLLLSSSSLLFEFFWIYIITQYLVIYKSYAFVQVFHNSLISSWWYIGFVMIICQVLEILNYWLIIFFWLQLSLYIIFVILLVIFINFSPLLTWGLLCLTSPPLDETLDPALIFLEHWLLRKLMVIFFLNKKKRKNNWIS